jgi:DNA-binding NarL/FixJ family response regulator
MDESEKINAAKSLTGTSQPWLSRVFIVDDHRFFSFALTSLINTQADLAACGVGHDESSALDGIIRTSPDLVVMDMRMQEQDGLKLAAAVRQLSKSVPILFISSLPNPAFRQEVKWLEPCSFVEKTQDPVDIIRGIRQALARFQVFQSLHPTSTYTQKT